MNQVRALVIDDVNRAKAKKVIDWAVAHPWYPDHRDRVPGSDDRFVAMLNDYRCVFSITHSHGTIFKHLTVSVPTKDDGKFPSFEAGFAIASMFGFEGWDLHKPSEPGPKWEYRQDRDQGCLAIIEEVSKLN